MTFIPSWLYDLLSVLILWTKEIEQTYNVYRSNYSLYIIQPTATKYCTSAANILFHLQMVHYNYKSNFGLNFTLNLMFYYFLFKLF